MIHHIAVPTQNIDFSDPLWPLEPNGSLVPGKGLPCLHRWCQENLAGYFKLRWRHVEGHFYCFVIDIENDADAVLFSLRWNGVVVTHEQLIPYF